eukprot:499379_1
MSSRRTRIASNSTSIDKSKGKKYDDHYALNGRSFWCGFGAIKWYFLEFKCDNSHQSFTIYLCILFLTWGIYYLGFHSKDNFFYAMLAGCLLGTIMGLYAIPKVKDIMEMRKALRELVKCNIRLRESQSEFENDVNSVDKAHSKIHEIQSTIDQTNVRLKSSYDQFNDYGNQLNEKNFENIQQLKTLKYYFEECKTNYQALLTRAEKSFLNAIYREIQKTDQKPGLSYEEFELFLKKLPNHYRRRFDPPKKVFCKYAGDDENMDYKEFQIMISNMARAEALGL